MFWKHAVLAVTVAAAVFWVPLAALNKVMMQIWSRAHRTWWILADSPWHIDAVGGGAVTSSQPVRTPLAALVCELLIEAIWTIFDLRRVGHNAILEVGLRGSGLITALVLLRMVVQVIFDPGE